GDLALFDPRDGRACRQLDAVLISYPSPDRRDRPHRHQAPLSQYPQSVGQLLRFLKIVRRQEDEPVFGELAKYVPKVPPRNRVEARRRLVEEDYFSLGCKNHRREDLPPRPS